MSREIPVVHIVPPLSGTVQKKPGISRVSTHTRNSERVTFRRQKQIVTTHTQQKSNKKLDSLLLSFEWQKNMMKLKQKPITINEEIQRCTREHSTYTCRSECGWPSNPAGWPQYCNPSNSKPRLLLFVGRNPRRSDVHWPIRNISPRPEPSSRDPDLNCRPAMNLLLLLLLLLIMWKKSSIIIRNSIHPSIHPSIEQNETLCLE